MAFLKYNGIKLHYQTWGSEGPWVTLINGHTRPLNDFRMLAKHLAGQGLRIVAMDNRGSGLTETTAPFTLDDMARDVESLWQELGIGTTHLLGISMGGFIAMDLAARLPGQVLSLVLVSTAGESSSVRQDDQPWTTSLEEVLTKLKRYVTEEFAERNSMLVTSMAKQIAKNVAEGGFAERAQAQRQALKQRRPMNNLQDLKASTLVIHGARDRIIDPVAAKQLDESLPNSKLLLIPDAGHLLLAEAPKQLYQAASKHFQEI